MLKSIDHLIRIQDTYSINDAECLWSWIWSWFKLSIIMWTVHDITLAETDTALSDSNTCVA